MNPVQLQPWLERLPGTRVLVVGDLMLDRYVYGDAERLSPEAPVPVVRVEAEEERLGGAANVARNVAALGGEPTLIGVVGDDAPGRRFLRLAEAGGIAVDGVIRSPRRPTAVKTRVICRGQQVVRIDREETGTLPADEAAALLDALAQVPGEPAAVVLSDYGKGVLAPATLERLRARLPHGVYTCVDPVPEHMAAYRGLTAATPNEREALAALGWPLHPHPEPATIAAALIERFELDEVFVTLGPRGMVWQADGAPAVSVPTRARQVYDVSGAGDTVVAVVAMLRGLGAPLEVAAQLANLAAGVVVEKAGTAVATLAELRDRLAQGG